MAPDDAPSDTAEPGQNGAVDAGEDAGAVDLSWDEICQRLRLDDPRMELLLRLFSERYAITDASDALVQIPRFLGDYMVREFDYKGFCCRLGFFSEDAKSAGDESEWTKYMVAHLRDDLVLASSLMLRCAAIIAKAYALEPADWQDVNDACSNAVSSVPTCYTIHRVLPGALSVARSWKFLPDFSSDDCDDPWTSDAGKDQFEESYGIEWKRIQEATANERHIESCFSGCFLVVEVTDVEWVSLVALDAIMLATAPAGFPAKTLKVGDRILWEVEQSTGKSLRPGLTIEADWYELDSEICFMAAPTSIAPNWLHELAG